MDSNTMIDTPTLSAEAQQHAVKSSPESESPPAVVLPPVQDNASATTTTTEPVPATSSTSYAYVEYPPGPPLQTNGYSPDRNTATNSTSTIPPAFQVYNPYIRTSANPPPLNYPVMHDQSAMYSMYPQQPQYTTTTTTQQTYMHPQQEYYHHTTAQYTYPPPDQSYMRPPTAFGGPPPPPMANPGYQYAPPPAHMQRMPPQHQVMMTSTKQPPAASQRIPQDQRNSPSQQQPSQLPPPPQHQAQPTYGKAPRGRPSKMNAAPEEIAHVQLTGPISDLDPVVYSEEITRSRIAERYGLTFQKYYSEEFPYERIRVWKSKGGLTFYDCACGKRKPSQGIKKMREHVDRHPSRAYKCSVCFQIYEDHSLLQAHQSTHM